MYGLTRTSYERSVHWIKGPTPRSAALCVKFQVAKDSGRAFDLVISQEILEYYPLYPFVNDFYDTNRPDVG